VTAPPTAKLSGAALRKLRGLGHALDAVVAIGKDGMTDALVRAVDTAIGTHELVKVKIQRGAPVDRHEAGIELAARTGSVLAQVLGGTLLLYRRHPKKPKIELTEAKKARSGKTTSQRERKTSGKAVETASDETEDPGDNG
jgi:RNA-binding protein